MARNLYLKRLTDALGSFSDWESVGGDSAKNANKWNRVMGVDVQPLRGNADTGSPRIAT
jgi:hypothetical protein